MYGNVSYQGTPPIGNNPGNVLSTLMMRLMGGQRGGPTQYGSPEGEMAMARMLGLEGAQGMPRDPRMMGRGMAGPPMPAGGMPPPVPMSRPMGMGLGGGMAANAAMPGWRPQGAQFDPSAVDPRKLALMAQRARMPGQYQSPM